MKTLVAGVTCTIYFGFAVPIIIRRVLFQATNSSQIVVSADYIIYKANWASILIFYKNEFYENQRTKSQN